MMRRLASSVLCLAGLFALGSATSSSICVQDCFESASNVDRAPESVNLKNDDAKKAKFKHFCKVSESLTTCWKDCKPSEMRNDFLNYTQGIHDGFCSVSNGFKLFEERGKAINECLRKGRVAESAVTALLFSGGNSSRVPAENLCDFATFVEIFTNDAGCDARDKSAILHFTRVAYRFQQLKLGIERTPERCERLDNVMSSFVNLVNSTDHVETRAPSKSLDCLQACLTNVTNEKLVLGDSGTAHKNPSKFAAFCEIVHGLSDCWIRCPRGLVHDSIASVTNKFRRQFCEASGGPALYGAIYNELNTCGNGTLDSHMPRSVALHRGNISNAVAENLCSAFQAVGKPTLSKAYSGCSFDVAELLRDGFAFGYAFVNLKLGISDISTGCAGILKGVVNSQVLIDK
ncbi:hypothetical protein AAVH_02300 [Aphelenchoides avenae]|nr:hypothetical protein AAVH_02300 [Aphelenchus avenae]